MWILEITFYKRSERSLFLFFNYDFWFSWPTIICFSKVQINTYFKFSASPICRYTYSSIACNASSTYWNISIHKSLYLLSTPSAPLFLGLIIFVHCVIRVAAATWGSRSSIGLSSLWVNLTRIFISFIPNNIFGTYWNNLTFLWCLFSEVFVAMDEKLIQDRLHDWPS